MAKQSRYDLALANIDARLGALRDIANFLSEHKDAALVAERSIAELQTARNLLTSAGESATAKPNGKPRTRKARKAGLPTSAAADPAPHF